MKRKLFTVMMMVLIVCLLGSMVIFAACNDNNPDDPKTDPEQWTADTGDSLDAVFEKLSAIEGSKLGFDISAAYVDKAKAESGEMKEGTKFSVALKGNFDVERNDEGAVTKNDVDFLFDVKDGKGKTLFGLGFEVIDNEPYFYININGNYEKVNGYSVVAIYDGLVKTIDGVLEDNNLPVNVNTILTLVESILPTILEQVFEANCTVTKGNDYIFDFNLANMMGNLNDMIDSILDGPIGGFIKDVDIKAEIDKVIAGLGIEGVASLQDLVDLVEETLPEFGGTVAFNFADNDKFEGIDVNFSNANKGEITNEYQIDLNTNIGEDVTVNTFNNFVLSDGNGGTTADRAAVEAKNLLNFDINGTITTGTYTTEEGKELYVGDKTFNLSIDSDINPMVLFDLLTVEGADVIETVKQLGYFHFSLDEVLADKTTKNVITLHSTFEDGTVVVNVDFGTLTDINIGELLKQAGVDLGDFAEIIALIPAFDLPLTIGGEITFEEIGAAVSALMPKEDNKDALVAADGTPSIGDILDMIKSVIGKDENNDLILDLRGIVDIVLPLIMGTVDENTQAIVDKVFDAIGFDAMGFSVAMPEFGGVADSDKVSTDEVKENIKFNPFNFALDGTAKFLDDKGAVKNNFVISVDADLNPFALVNLFNGTDKNSVLNALRELGYFNFTVDEIKEDGTLKQNIITIHSNFAEGQAIVQLNSYSIVIYKVALGGPYEFEALYDMIAAMTAGSAAEGDDPVPPLDIMGLIKDILGLTNLDIADIAGSFADINQNGFNLRMSGIMDVIDKIMDVDADVALGMTLRDLLPSLWKSADMLNIKLGDFTFGTYERKETSEISAMKSTASKGFLDPKAGITIEGFPTTIYGDGAFAIGLDKNYKLKGTNVATGKPVTIDGYIIAHTPIDYTKDGKQDVTLYVAPANNAKGIIGMVSGMLPIDLGTLPIFGCYAVDVTIDMHVNDKDAEVALKNFKPDRIPMVPGSNILSTSGILTSSNGYLTINGLDHLVTANHLTVLNDKGEDVTATVLVDHLDGDGNVDGKTIMEKGVYEIVVAIGNYSKSVEVDVMNYAYKNFPANYVSNPLTGAQFTLDDVVYTLGFESGKLIAKAAEGDSVKEVTIVSMEWKKAGSGDNVVIDKNTGIITPVNENKSGMRYNNVYYTIIIEGCTFTGNFSVYELYASNKTDKNSIDINGNLDGAISYVDKIVYTPEGATEAAALEFKYGKDGYGIYIKDTDTKVYDVKVTVNAYDKDGKLVDEPTALTNGKFTVAGKYKVQYEMTVNGVAQKFYHDVEVKDNITLLSAPNKNGSYNALSIGDKCDGFITYVNALAYYDENGVKQTLEFKFENGKYGFFYAVVEGDKKTYVEATGITVEMVVKDADGKTVTLTDGAFTAAGDYTIEYTVARGETENKFTQKIKVKAE